MLEEQVNPFFSKNVRRSLPFVTPAKTKKNFDFRSNEIQQTPKGKFSKTKAIHKLSKNKRIIDFDVDKNHFLNVFLQDNFKEEESKKEVYWEESFNSKQDLYETPKNTLCEESPLKTIRKSQYSGQFNNVLSMVKQPKRTSSTNVSAFCSLLNESDHYSAEKYQLLSGNDDYEESDGCLDIKVKH